MHDVARVLGLQESSGWVQVGSAAQSMHGSVLHQLSVSVCEYVYVCVCVSSKEESSGWVQVGSAAQSIHSSVLH